MDKPDKNNDRKFDPKEKLRVENEIEKLKLSAFHDAEFFSKSELPPEIENEWLKYITQFEEQFEKASRITIAERLGNPEFPSVEELTEKEIEENLKKVLDLMAENSLFIDALADTSSLEIYRFIIEELFAHEIDDIKIEGMSTNFIYEEFHPNDGWDIEQRVTDFIHEMLSDDFRDYLDMHLAENCKAASGEAITKKEAANKAYLFGDLYDQFVIEKLDGFQIEIDETNTEASLQFNLSFRTISRDESKKFEGPASASLCRGELGYWNIVSLTMPGFSL